MDRLKEPFRGYGRKQKPNGYRAFALIGIPGRHKTPFKDYIGTLFMDSKS